MKARKPPPRDEIELGRALQRELLQRRPDHPSDGASAAAEHHSDQPSADKTPPPPREDRAG